MVTGPVTRTTDRPARIRTGAGRSARLTSRRPGFSLIEALLALVLFASGVLAVGGAATRATRSLRHGERMHGARVAAGSVADSLGQLASPGPAATMRGRYGLDWMVADSGAVAVIRIRVRWLDGTRTRADSMDAFAAVTPARLHAVP